MTNGRKVLIFVLTCLLLCSVFGSAQSIKDQLTAANALDQKIAASGNFGNVLYVDTVNGSNINSCYAPAMACKTMAAAFLKVADYSRIYVVGDVREELLTPLGVQGVQIIGAANGANRHDDGVRWREPASGATTSGALLTIREQGWEVHNILFVPKTDATAVRLRRAEDATYPDGSHAVITHCKFIGNVAFGAAGLGIGIEDHGGSHHDYIADNEFVSLASGIKSTAGAGIAAPLRWTIEKNTFIDNAAHIVLPANQSIIKDNVFDKATTNINTSGATGGNFVIGNYFSDAQASVANSAGYTGHATDVWRNYTTNTAATTVGVPGA